jgi:tRNA(Ile)-lysidine synthase
LTPEPPLVERILDFIRRHGLLNGGEIVLVAVSGGADSVGLLHVLRELRSRLDLTLHVAHVNHGLRHEAERDEVFVETLCRRLGVACRIERVTVARHPDRDPPEHWAGPEAEARRQRYAAFRRIAATVRAHHVATAHTADDQAETVLMRLLQGAGPRGLAGIPLQRGRYIRPLLGTRRAEIEAFLRQRGESWVEDSSNRNPAYLRNRIRHELVPFLTDRYEPRIVSLLCRSADLVRTLVADIDRRATDALARLGRSTPAGLVFRVDDLRGLTRAVSAETIRLAAVRAGDAGPLRSPAHRAIARLLDPGVARTRERLGPVVLERSGRWLRVGPGVLAPLRERAWSVPGALSLDEVGVRLEASVRPRPADYVVPRHRLAAVFDADQMPSTLVVRGRRSGERFEPFGAIGDRRLKALLIDAGIPRWERDRLPVVEANGEVVWVAGVRRGRAAPVTASTRRILEVTVQSSLAVESVTE